MGVEIVKAVAGHPGTSKLSGNAFKVLVAMALHALDKPKDGRPAGLYFGGWGALQLTLGYDESDRESAAHAAVKRAIRELRDGKHITPMTTAARGHRQSYLVHPGGLMGDMSDPQSTPTPAEERGTPSVPKRGTVGVPKRGTKHAPKGGHPVSLLGHIEEGRGQTEDKLVQSETQPQTAHGTETPKTSRHKFRGRPGEDCDVCGKGYQNRRVHPLHAVEESA